MQRSPRHASHPSTNPTGTVAEPKPNDAFKTNAARPPQAGHLDAPSPGSATQRHADRNKAPISVTDTPEAVVLYNTRTRTTFGAMSPAEARLALDYIAGHREAEAALPVAALDYARKMLAFALQAAPREAGPPRTFKEVLGDVFRLIEDRDYAVTGLWINAQTLRSLRNAEPNAFDPVTLRNLVVKGYVGDFWGAQILIDKTVPLNTLIAFADEKDGQPGEFVITKLPELLPTKPDDYQISLRLDRIEGALNLLRDSGSVSLDQKKRERERIAATEVGRAEGD